MDGPKIKTSEKSEKKQVSLFVPSQLSAKDIGAAFLPGVGQEVSRFIWPSTRHPKATNKCQCNQRRAWTTPFGFLFRVSVFRRIPFIALTLQDDKSEAICEVS